MGKKRGFLSDGCGWNLVLRRDRQASSSCPGFLPCQVLWRSSPRVEPAFGGSAGSIRRALVGFHVREPSNDPAPGWRCEESSPIGTVAEVRMAPITSFPAKQQLESCKHRFIQVCRGWPESLARPMQESVELEAGGFSSARLPSSPCRGLGRGDLDCVETTGQSHTYAKATTSRTCMTLVLLFVSRTPFSSCTMQPVFAVAKTSGARSRTCCILRRSKVSASAT